jgi:hypothetical protein
MKADRRERLQDSLFKGVFLIFGPLVVALGIAVAVGSLRGDNVDDNGLDRVWSAEHSHWHAILPDGTETEVQEGMVWNAEHGHFHRVAAPTGALRGHQTDRLDQKLDDAESLVEQ